MQISTSIDVFFYLSGMRYLEGRVGAFQLVALLHALGAAVLGVAPILQSPPLLLEPDDLFAREAVEFLVEFADRERNELVVVQQVVTPSVMVVVVVMMMSVMSASSRIGAQADCHSDAAARAAHLGTRRRTGRRRTGTASTRHLPNKISPLKMIHTHNVFGVWTKKQKQTTTDGRSLRRRDAKAQSLIGIGWPGAGTIWEKFKDPLTPAQLLDSRDPIYFKFNIKIKTFARPLNSSYWLLPRG